MKNIQSTCKKGFTFIEVLLYMGIVSFILGAIISFAWNIIDFGVKSAIQQEVSAQARYISERLKYEIRNANSIQTSDFGVNLADDASKNISVSQDTPHDPTRIFVQDNQVFIQQGTADSVSLQSADTIVTSLVFMDYSSADGSTQYVDFTVTVKADYPNANGRQEYQESVTIESGAEVRSH